MSFQPPAPPEETVRRVLDARGTLTYAVDPAPTVLDALVRTLDGSDADPGARLLVRTEQLKDQVEDFLFASLLANLDARDAVAYRTAPAFPNGNLLLFGDAAVQLFDLEGRLAAVSTDAEPVREALASQAAERWEGAEPFSLRTPARSAVTETIGDELGQTARGDFAGIVDSLDTARGDGHGLDEVTIALLVAAKNEALLYDISKWGEDVGLASKATFSRTKSDLEELGLIATEKVPIDVGRPRLRLKFADERLRSADADELASVALGLME
ncbi:MAG: DUF5821 family protein [Halobacteriales archaeon]|nr:DUF5821 family protein [Halobacteriales archaeon]